ncbi:MAG: phosphatase PAP2 family protein [Anaerolineales bacterium]|nr:phosphatase PAP2 family protein [Anaerolineales bacterium]
MNYWIPGITLILLGLSHRWNVVQRADHVLFHRVHRLFNSSPWSDLFQELWFLGRTLFTLLGLVLITLINWQQGLTAAGIFGLAAGLERIIKLRVNRSRPFQVLENARMLQLRKPRDPSFPSGDALRVWFLALVLPSLLTGSPWVQAFACTAALAVSLGRMVLGVHFLTDVLAGAGLGILAAGITHWIWAAFHLV